VRDARSDTYARVHGLVAVSARPVFVVRDRLSKIERGPGLGCSCLVRSRMLSRVWPVVPAASLADVVHHWFSRRSPAPSRSR
jgi:hypothetical protein